MMTDLARAADEILARHPPGEETGFWNDWREVLMSRGDYGEIPGLGQQLDIGISKDLDELMGLVARLHEDPITGREWLTQAALDASLCPLHWRDYAICFDDDDPECAAIRIIHPGRDN
jgi:hypothetical protein